MESLGKECTELKKQYDQCFHKWYSEQFLKGNITRECDELFEAYKQCIWKTLKEKKLDHAIEESRKRDKLSEHGDH
jgi:TRIAP1/MDM35 family protein